MVVKKPNLGNNSKALATTNGKAANGALVQAVCTSPLNVLGSVLNVVKETFADGGGIGTANECVAGSCDGTYWSLRGGLLCEI
jgi:hypothetical protein